MREKILFVDDDPGVLEFYQGYLRETFLIETAPGPEEALALVRNQGPYAVIVSDMNMPGMNGIDLLIKVQEMAPDTVRVMLTGDAEQQTAMMAINQGHIFQFLTKPCPLDALASTLRNSLKQHRLLTAERELLEHTLSGSIKMLTDILSIVEPRSFGESQKMREYARLLSEFLKITPSWEIEMAAMLCRVGYVTVPPAIIERMHAGISLSAVEKGLLMRAPEFGRNLLENIPRLEAVAQLVYYQNKNFDGTGFPKDDSDGEKIPLGSRILKILGDLVEHESKGVHRIQALTQMKQSPGRYDPKLLSAALHCLLFEKKGQGLMLKELRVGQVLLSAIETYEGMLIVPAGQRVSPMLLRKLQNFTELSSIKEPIYVEG
jgi:response regulator RpfG family c-di-GMP phosphodiesterase